MVTAEADPGDLVDEENEANNEAMSSWSTRTLFLGVATDQLAYGPRSPIAIEVTVRNDGGAGRSPDLMVRLVDASGALVSPLAAQPVAMAAGETATLSFGAETGDLLPGGYAVIAELTEDGRLVASSSALIRLGAVVSGTASIWSDRDLYTPQQAAIFLGRVLNTSPNVTLRDAVARLAVRDAGGAEVFVDERTLLALFPGAEARVNASWEIANAPAGDYTASLDLRDAGGRLVAYAETRVTVESSSETGAGLEGAITVAPELVGAGAPLAVGFQVANLGNADMPDLGLRFDLFRVDDGAVVDARQRQQPLYQGQSASGGVGFPTQGLAEGTYLVTLVALLPAGDLRLDRAALSVVSGVSIADAAGAEGDAALRSPSRCACPRPARCR